jgi:hypothetical protein
MKGIRQSNQCLTEQKEKEPRDEDPCNTLKHSLQSRERAPFACVGRFPRLQTRRAENAVVVFSNAFATKEVPALGALCGRLSNGVIETTLVCDSRHLAEKIQWSGAR